MEEEAVEVVVAWKQTTNKLIDLAYDSKGGGKVSSSISHKSDHGQLGP